MAIQETKLVFMDLFSVRAYWGNVSFMHAFSPSCVASNGILVIWEPDRIQYTHVVVSEWFVVAEAVWILNGLDVLLITIYALKGLIVNVMFGQSFSL